MKKLQTLQRLTNGGVVAVVRADTKEEAINISSACIDGGISGIEITFTVAEADTVIKELAKMHKDSQKVVIGAGTVLDEATARLAILAGAQFVVSPAFDGSVAKLCNRYQIPYLPGCMTITEIVKALEAGVDMVKLFPGSTLKPDFVKAVKGPFPDVNIMPTGGVSLDNVQHWIKAGCTVVGVGGNLIAPAKTGEFGKITEVAQAYVEKVRAAKGAQW